MNLNNHPDENQTPNDRWKFWLIILCITLLNGRGGYMMSACCGTAVGFAFSYLSEYGWRKRNVPKGSMPAFRNTFCLTDLPMTISFGVAGSYIVAHDLGRNISYFWAGCIGVVTIVLSQGLTMLARVFDFPYTRDLFIMPKFKKRAKRSDKEL